MKRTDREQVNVPTIDIIFEHPNEKLYLAEHHQNIGDVLSYIAGYMEIDCTLDGNTIVGTLDENGGTVTVGKIGKEEFFILNISVGECSMCGV